MVHASDLISTGLLSHGYISSSCAAAAPCRASSMPRCPCAGGSGCEQGGMIFTSCPLGAEAPVRYFIAREYLRTLGLEQNAEDKISVTAYIKNPVFSTLFESIPLQNNI